MFPRKMVIKKKRKHPLCNVHHGVFIKNLVGGRNLLRIKFDPIDALFIGRNIIPDTRAHSFLI